jgi:hypothetical protein
MPNSNSKNNPNPSTDNDNTTPTNPSAIKNGIKTTEFWATILGSILVAGAAEFGIDLTQTAAVSVTTMVLAYVVGRFTHKNKQIKS